MLKYYFILLPFTGRDGVFNLLWITISMDESIWIIISYIPHNINGSAHMQPLKLTRRNAVFSFLMCWKSVCLGIMVFISFEGKRIQLKMK